MPDPLRAKLVSESASGLARASISPFRATRNCVRFACDTCYEKLRSSKPLARRADPTSPIVADDLSPLP